MGFPHSDITGSKRICRSPVLIAAYHVLHRLWMPRHSLCALSNLTKNTLVTRPHPCGYERITIFFGEDCMFPSYAIVKEPPSAGRHRRPASGKWLEVRLFLAGLPCVAIHAPRAARRFDCARLRLASPRRSMVGVPGFEPGTSSLSGTRSNQLSYTPFDPAPQGGTSLRAGPQFVWMLMACHEQANLVEWWRQPGSNR